MPTTKLPTTCDMVIAGAGLAGTAAALAFTRMAPGRSVLLVDAGTRQHPAHEETLTQEARPLLERLDGWDDFVAEGFASAHGTLGAWGDGELRSRPFLFAEPGRGWRLERSALARRLVATARSHGVAVMKPARLLEVRRNGDRGWRLEIGIRERTMEIGSRFVIDATGRPAYLARRLGARKVRYDRLVGAFVVFDATPPVAETGAEGSGVLSRDAVVEAREEGFWYCSAHPETEKVVVAFLTDADLAREKGIGTDAAWHELFSRSALAEELGPGIYRQTHAPPTIRAMDSHRLDHMVGPGWLAVGDAAATADFLAGRGLCEALDMGIRAADAALDELAGRRTGLHRYQRTSEVRFEQLLDRRRELYGREDRFRGHAFWLRREDRVTLGLDQLVAFTESADRDNRLEGLGMHLPVAQLRLLCSLCAAPRLVESVLGAFRERYTAPGSSPPSQRRLLLALQYLVEHGLVTAE